MTYAITLPATEASIKKTPSPTTLDKVLAAIDQQITAKPIRRFGKTWCRFSRNEMAGLTGLHIQTIGRCLNSNAIQFDIVKIDKVKSTILRRNDGKISEEYNYRLLDKAMKSIFNKTTKHDITAR